MALNQMLQTIAKSIAEDELRCYSIQTKLREASELGPWRYSTDEVSEMWDELTDRHQDLLRRGVAIRTVYDPTVARAIFEEVYSLIYDGVT